MASNPHGFKNEIIISKYLNGKKVCELNDNMQKFIYWLMEDDVSENDIVYSDKVQKPLGEKKNPKTDIWIRIKNRVKNISVKEGSGNSVHQEPMREFVEFLSKIDVDNDYIEKLKFYHYGDGTTDDTGEKRFSTSYIKIEYKDIINSVNNRLNEKKYLLKILDRILFVGTLKKPIQVDACYHGDVNKGLWASRLEILSFLTENIPSNMSGIMFSYLTYQPWTRDENRTAKHPDRRQVMQVKWGAIEKNLLEITKGRQNGKK